MSIYDVVDVTSWPVRSEEPLGSKEKDWLRHPEREELWLWKAAREGTGDDWAEKVAEQLADAIHLPHAIVELAQRRGRRGIISRDFRRRAGSFVPGNELLWLVDPSYPRTQRRKVAQHTVDRVLDRLQALSVLPPPGAVDWYGHTESVLVGYLLFDAWIGNQDRHHENWGVIAWDDAIEVEGPTEELDPGANRRISLTPSLAPSFDHASSMGQYEPDRMRELRLRTRDKGGALETWARKATSQLYKDEHDERPLGTFDAFGRAVARYPFRGRDWLERLRDVSAQAMERAVDSVPAPLLSPIGREFVNRLLAFNRLELLTRFSP